MLHVKNINKTRRALQITVCAIHKLLKDAYETDKLVEDKIIDFDLWCAEKCEEQPTFKYWYMIQKIVLIYLVMMKSIREGDFEAYKCSLSAIIPYFFSNDNTHYSRWGTIHLHDMLSLQEKCPSIYNEFVNLSPIAKSCAELCKCGCKKECSGRCSCKQSNLPCTSRCSCSCIN